MPRVTPLINNLNGGEFDRRMVANTNFGSYPKGSAQLKNLLLLEQGGLTRRPGTKFVKEVKDSTDTDHRLIPFVFNADQAYMLELGDLYIRFYTDLGRLEDPPGTPVEIVSPWTSAQLDEIDFAQRADIMNLVHPDVSPRRLSRVDNLTWTLTEIDFNDGPWLDENITATTVNPSGLTGAITLTASTAIFDSDHVGALWRIGKATGVADITEWTASTAITVGDRVKYDGVNGINVYKAASTGTTGTIPPEHLSGTRNDGTIDFEYLHTDIYGFVEITGFTSSTVVDATVISTELATANPTVFWQEGAWSAFRGYPRTVAFHESRAAYASTAFQPQTVWLSKTQELDNFQKRTNSPDDDPIDRTIDSKRPDVFFWMESATRLFLGGSDSISALRGSSIGEPLTPTNITRDLVNNTPSADVQPIPASTALLFMESNGRHLNELLLTGQFEGEPLASTDMSVLNQTILKPGVKELAWQTRPHRTLWTCKSDGKLATFVYNREQEVIGWGQQEIAGGSADDFGIVRSIAAIPGSASAGTVERTEIWMIVERTIDGGTVAYVEYLEAEFEDDTDVEDQFFVDSGLTFSGAATDTITGLDHLEGETVQVLGDGASEPDVVVSSGQVVLTREVTKAQIGLKSPYLWQSLKMEIGSQTGTSQGKLKRINEVVLVLDRTFQASTGPSETEQQIIYGLSAGDPMDAPRPLFTGEFREQIEGDWETDPRLYSTGDHAGNFTLLAIRPTVTGAET